MDVADIKVDEDVEDTTVTAVSKAEEAAAEAVAAEAVAAGDTIKAPQTVDKPDRVTTNSRTVAVGIITTTKASNIKIKASTNSKDSNSRRTLKFLITLGLRVAGQPLHPRALMHAKTRAETAGTDTPSLRAPKQPIKSRRRALNP